MLFSAHEAVEEADISLQPLLQGAEFSTAVQADRCHAGADGRCVQALGPIARPTVTLHQRFVPLTAKHDQPATGAE
ncbi:hypothetical protein D3C80_2105200 [compost metagenome]